MSTDGSSALNNVTYLEQPQAQVAAEPQDLAKLAAKLARVVSEIDRVPKSGHNKYFDFKFAEEGDIKDLVRPLLAKHGIAMIADMVSCNVETTETEVEYWDNKAKELKSKIKVTHRTTITMRYMFIDSESGAMISGHWTNHADDSSDKGVGKAATLGLKYFLINTFLISTGEKDMDPDAGMEREPEYRNKRSDKPTTKAAQNGSKDEPWATADNLITLYTTAEKKFPGISQKEFADAVGIADFNDFKAWAKMFKTGQAAGTAVIDALQAQMGVVDDGPQQQQLIDETVKDLAKRKANPYSENFQ